MYCYGGRQIDVLEDVRKQVLQGSPEVQKHFYGGHAFQDFHKLKEVVVTFQSCKASTYCLFCFTTITTFLDENDFFLFF